MKLKIVTLGAALSVLSGCGNQSEVKIQPISKTAEAAIQEVETKAPETYFTKLLAGETINILLDVCDPADGEKWLGEEDSIGVLVCGTHYVVNYDAESNRMMTKGLIESQQGGEHKSSYNGRVWSGKTNRFNIWGGPHYMNDDGEIMNSEQEIIGHIVP